MNNVSDIFIVAKAFGAAIFNFWWAIFPIAFFYIFKVLWIDYVGWYSEGSWYASQKWTVLEVFPPREIEKGPKSMESFFVGLTGVLTTYDVFSEYMKGSWFHDRFSMELVGEEGKIHFYIRTQKKHRNMVEAQIYAQYPDAEIVEVEDYTQKFPKIVPNRRWDLWGSDFEFVGPAPYPIKTYDYFEESITGEMNDPMAAITEVLGTLGPGQHIWLQYVLQPLSEKWNIDKAQKAVVDKLTGRTTGAVLGPLDHLLDVFSNLWAGLFAPVEFKTTAKKEEAPLEFRLSPIEKERLKAVEENLGKSSFKTKMRMIVLGKKEVFDRAKIGAFIGAIKQFNDINFNSFKPNDISKTYANFVLKKERLAFRQRKIYNRYRNRNMDGALMVFSTKELATLYHFPDMGVKSPAIIRTESKLGAAPANLPVGE